jgi:DNA (cytosine-5)-methyltransferase 1
LKHFGDICKISGKEVPTVNVIIGGSPCQDLSVAGKRAGLNGERSGLFMEQIRIIKEMREKDEQSGRKGTDIRPRFMVWENVPGAFSVNDGKDFAAVLEEIIRVVDKEAPDIHVPKDGWTLSGCYMGSGYSVAWRVLDAQFWGVPQRRRRIALVADFGGKCAPEVLFERNGMSWNPKSCSKAWKESSGETENCIGATGELKSEEGRLNPWDVQSKSIYAENSVVGSLCSGTTEGMNIQPCVLQSKEDVEGFGETGLGYWQPGIQTLRAEGENRPSRPSNVIVFTDEETDVTAYGISSFCSNAMLSDNPNSGIYEATTSRTLDLNGGNPACNQGGICIVEPRTYVKQTSPHSADEAPTIVSGDISPTLNTMDNSETRTSVYVVENTDDLIVEMTSTKNTVYTDGIAPTLTARMGTGGNQVHAVLSEIDEPILLESNQNHATITNSGICPTLSASMGLGGGYVPMITEKQKDKKFYVNNGISDYSDSDVASTICARCYKDATDLVLDDEIPCGVDCRNATETPDISGTLQAKDSGGYSYNLNNVVRQKYIVRRLTPLECTRLQGYPDGWVDIGDWVDSKGKLHKDSDSPKYRALGNSIALPPWLYVLSKLNEFCEDKTMASLFSGIDGFPLIWSFLNGKESCVWASEIDEFCIALSKKRFPDTE